LKEVTREHIPFGINSLTVLTAINLLTNFEGCSFTRSKDMIGPQNLKISRDMTTPIWGGLLF